MIDLRNPSLTARAVIDALNLLPHPEGGHYRETWRDRPETGGRGHSTAILFLLAGWEESAWHKVDADELWFWHGGAPLALSVATQESRQDGPQGKPVQTVKLGADYGSGQRPQGFVPRDHWQSAAALGEWVLVSCVVAPAFQFAGFELAPPGWKPG